MIKARILSRMNRCEDRVKSLSKWYMEGILSEKELIDSMKDEKRKYTYFKHMIKGDV